MKTRETGNVEEGNLLNIAAHECEDTGECRIKNWGILNLRVKSKLYVTEIDFIRLSARCSKLDQMRNI